MYNFLLQLKMLLLSCLAVFLPVKSTLLAVMALTVVDLILGVWSSIKQGQPITSSGLKRTIVKVFVYNGVVMLGFLTEQYLTGDSVPIVKILGGYIGLTELKSCMENMEGISGVSILKALIDKLSQSGGPQ